MVKIDFPGFGLSYGILCVVGLPSQSYMPSLYFITVRVGAAIRMAASRRVVRTHSTRRNRLVRIDFARVAQQTAMYLYEKISFRKHFFNKIADQAHK